MAAAAPAAPSRSAATHAASVTRAPAQQHVSAGHLHGSMPWHQQLQHRQPALRLQGNTQCSTRPLITASSAALASMAANGGGCWPRLHETPAHVLDLRRRHLHTQHQAVPPSHIAAQLLVQQEQRTEPVQQQQQHQENHSPICVGPLSMAPNEVHILWSFPDQVDWQQQEHQWLAQLPAEDVAYVTAAREQSDQRTRLLARILQRATVSAALQGITAGSSSSQAMQSSMQQQPAADETRHNTGSSSTPQPLTPLSFHTHSTSNQASDAVAASCRLPHTSAQHTTANRPADEGWCQPRSVSFRRNKHGKPFLIMPGTSSPVDAALQGQASQPATSSSGLEHISSDAQHAAPASGVSPAGCMWAADLGAAAQHGPVLVTPASPEPSVQFNISHTNGIVGCVVAPAGWAVGLDVEQHDRVPRAGVMSLARRRFAAAEVAALQACTDDAARAVLFARLWSLKEAFVKARGTGISAAPGLKGFAIGVDAASQSGPDQLDLSAALHALCGVSCNPSVPAQSAAGDANCDQPLLRLTVNVTPCETHTGQQSWEVAAQHVSSATGSSQPQQGEANGLSPVCHYCDMVACPLATAPVYHLLLFQPSPAHVAALCVALPAHQAHLWPRESQAEAAALSPALHHAHQRHGVHVHMWHAMPGQPLQPVDLAVAPSSTSQQRPSAILLGCTLRAWHM